MRRSLSVRIVTVVFVILMSAPAFAAPRGDDSPFGSIERVLTRIVKIVRTFLPLEEAQPSPVKP